VNRLRPAQFQLWVALVRARRRTSAAPPRRRAFARTTVGTGQALPITPRSNRDPLTAGPFRGVSRKPRGGPHSSRSRSRSGRGCQGLAPRTVPTPLDTPVTGPFRRNPLDLSESLRVRGEDLRNDPALPVAVRRPGRGNSRPRSLALPVCRRRGNYRRHDGGRCRVLRVVRTVDLQSGWVGAGPGTSGCVPTASVGFGIRPPRGRRVRTAHGRCTGPAPRLPTRGIENEVLLGHRGPRITTCAAADARPPSPAGGERLARTRPALPDVHCQSRAGPARPTL